MFTIVVARAALAAQTGLLLVGLALICAPVDTAEAGSKGARWGASYFPNFNVVSQHGKTYRFFDDLIKDKIVVINFIYTSCPDICGLQTARMSIIQDKLGDRLGRDIFIYSISLDPKRDTPSVLKQYAAAFGVKPGWLFLTGDPAQVHKIRYKLGERSRSLAEHRNDAVLGNDRTHEWGRSSMMLSLERLTRDILEMDPKVRNERRRTVSRRAYSKAPTYKIGKQRGQALFLKACSACHSVGMGKRVGPDLEGAHTRRRRAWLIDYMVAPDRARKRGDTIALELRKSYPGVLMPNLGLSKSDAKDVIAYLIHETSRLQRGGPAQ
ncbi:MAG: SCO family protein [Hyphomicrobiaceae bacterium]